MSKTLGKDIIKTIGMDLTLLDHFDIKEHFFYKDFNKATIKKMIEHKEKGYKIYPFNAYEQGVLKESRYLDKNNLKGYITELVESTSRFNTFDTLNNSIEQIKNTDLQVSDVISRTNNILTQIQYNGIQNNNTTTGIDYIEKYKKETKEMQESKRNRFYTLGIPVLNEFIRAEKGWSMNLLAGTGGGKSIIACILTIEFIKKYKERVLFVTDENSESTILQYLQCAYFGLHFRSVQDRTMDLSKYIDSLSEKDRIEYEEIFSLIEVWELVGIPLQQVKQHILNSDKEYSFLIMDSFDEINSTNGLEDVINYQQNGKLIETLAKELNVLLLVTAQLDTKLYSTSAEKLPELCNHQAKSLVKKSFMSLVIHKILDKDGALIDTVVKLNKCRSGGKGKMVAFKENFDYMSINFEVKEYDLNRIKEKKVKELDF